jgi:hypothetical protein
MLPHFVVQRVACDAEAFGGALDEAGFVARFRFFRGSCSLSRQRLSHFVVQHVRVTLRR